MSKYFEATFHKLGSELTLCEDKATKVMTQVAGFTNDQGVYEESLYVHYLCTFHTMHYFEIDKRVKFRDIGEPSESEENFSQHAILR